MGFNFPNTPTEGQIFGGYVWDGEKWIVKDSGDIVHIGTTPPDDPLPGEQWFDSTDGAMYIWYDDGTSSQWVQTNGGSSASIVEAPIDGRVYGRKNAVWTRVQERLAANLNLYVNAATGSDSNDGMTSITAFATIQAAIDLAVLYDLAIFQIAINVADGSYAKFNLKSYVGTGPISIIGNIASPANVIVSAVNDSAVKVEGVQGLWVVRGIKVTTSGAAGDGFFIINVSQVSIGNVDFGACIGSHIQVQQSYAYVIAPCHISGGAQCHYNASTGGIFDSFLAHTSAGALNFSLTFANSAIMGLLYTVGSTYGAAAALMTGQRYYSSLNAVIHTGSGNPAFFPGNAAGAAAFGGQYT